MKNSIAIQSILYGARNNFSLIFLSGKGYAVHFFRFRNVQCIDIEIQFDADTFHYSLCLYLLPLSTRFLGVEQAIFSFRKIGLSTAYVKEILNIWIPSHTDFSTIHSLHSINP